MKRRILSLVIAQIVAPQPRYGLAIEVDSEAHAKLPDPVKALYVEADGKFRLDVDGVEDVTGLKSSLTASREDTRKAKEEARKIAERYKGVDVERYNEIMARLDNEDDQKAFKEGGIDSLVKRKLAKTEEGYKKAIDDLTKSKDTEIDGLKKKTSKYEVRVLGDHVRSAAAKAGMHATAMDDAVLHARNMFILDDEANAVMLDEDQKPVLGKGGKPYSVDEWIEEMKEKKPHWFPAGNTGSGAPGGDRGAGGAKTLTRSQFEKLNAAERQEKLKGGFKIVNDPVTS